MPTLIAFVMKTWPPSFPGTRLDVLSNGSLRWRTIQNRRSRREIPAKCFAKVSPRKVLILRDAFLEWLAAEMKVKFSSPPPVSPHSDFDAEIISNTLVAHIGQLETTSPAAMAKIASIQLSIAPVVTYRIEAVITPKS